MLLYSHRERRDYQGTGEPAQDVHLLFYTAPELCLHFSSVLLYVHGDHTVWDWGAQDVHLLFYTAPSSAYNSVLLCDHRDHKDCLGLGSSGRPPQLSHGFLALMSSILLLQCCFTSTENVRTIRDGFPELGGGFTQLLSSVYILPHSGL